MQGQDQASVAALRQGDVGHPSITAAERALLALVKLVTEQAWRCQSEDTDKVRQAGWTDPQIAEAVYITALFAFFNRVADAFGLEDPHYELMAQPHRPAQVPWEEGGSKSEEGGEKSERNGEREAESAG